MLPLIPFLIEYARQLVGHGSIDQENVRGAALFLDRAVASRFPLAPPI
jgi:hypothetical protein